MYLLRVGIKNRQIASKKKNPPIRHVYKRGKVRNINIINFGSRVFSSQDRLSRKHNDNNYHNIMIIIVIIINIIITPCLRFRMGRGPTAVGIKKKKDVPILIYV